MLRAEFIQSRILRARDRRLAYLAIHNHGGTDSVAFSRDDMASHERGYPALLDIARGMPVGALVFARSAVAGDLWFPGCDRAPAEPRDGRLAIDDKLLFPMPERKAAAVGMYDRQSRLFGDAVRNCCDGRAWESSDWAAPVPFWLNCWRRLGVGEFVLADPDRAEVTNLPRLVAARRRDAFVPSWVPRTHCGPIAPTQGPTWRSVISVARAATPRIEALARDFLEAGCRCAFHRLRLSLPCSGHDGGATSLQRNCASVRDPGHPGRRQDTRLGRTGSSGTCSASVGWSHRSVGVCGANGLISPATLAGRGSPCRRQARIRLRR